ncbi:MULTISPECIES: DUF106 domain-containing protein [Haloferax]|uniref:HTR-like protein n=5 Tax=Haloferax TaxID=2251 RepID=A0A384LQ21_HALVD|nr:MULTISPECIES: DUF106 domain-containing protein [Haloferax]ADE04827.1 DUF106 family protein [Haloferax volcanii DS2]ELY32642.1 HTR-like protein [Haloferax volcanii DS2]ELZ76058.1 HTR-like protein [Haloferax lucentense DSM 14919]MBC9987179.1 DUF106 domain-containing protein [Haloferax sp. AS1]MBS8118257.1 DUF106 domain-containing protein [Haloferax volcanii]
MARIESRVRDLVGSDADMRAAVETVLDRADDGEVEWADVRDELTSGQWGRLIEKGILVDGDEGFRLADAGETRAGLEDDTSGSGGSSSSSTDVDTGDSSWSKYDKGAAVVTVGLFLGYSVSEVRNVIGGVMDAALGPLAEMLPFYAVVMVLALATGLYSTLLQANLMDMEKMGKYQERMKDIQQRQKDAKERGDDAELEKIQEEQMEAMGDQMGMFKEQFRPMVWIMFLTIPVFLWMYWAIGVGGGSDPHIVTENIVLPLVGSVGWKQGVLGPMQAWIVWYFLCSMGFTQIIRKSLNIDMSPSAS